jgi:fucose 4-O-acetylase-like acetyltransferase
VTGRPAPAVSREPYWDNVRFVAIALVVVGHAIEPMTDSTVMTALYVAIYAFHMPLFAFVSGRFASAGPAGPARHGKLVTQLVVPYLVFNVIWFAVRTVVEGDVSLDLARPYQHLWFLVALVTWRLLLPVFAALRYPVTASVLVSVAAGYVGSVGVVFDSGKVFGMLPFFVLGWAVRERGLPGWATGLVRDTTALRAAAAALLAVPALAAYLLAGPVQDLGLRAWVRMAENYADIGFPQWWAGGVRLVLLAVAAVLMTAVLALVPRGAGRMTGWGGATMYVYMLHLFPLYLVEQRTDALDWFDSLPKLALLVVAAVAFTAVLSSRPVRRLTGPVVEPRVSWLLSAQARGGAPRPAPAGPVPVPAGPQERIRA